MKESSLEEVRSKAHELHDSGTAWHFHMFTPNCVLNTQNRYAFIIEQSKTRELWAYLSEQAEKDLDLELLPLLHGEKVFAHEPVTADYAPTEQVQQIVKRAKELNHKGIEWHHHMLFPDCQFNAHAGKFCLMLEDPETNEVYESITDEEPINDLQQIEPLFAGKVEK